MMNDKLREIRDRIGLGVIAALLVACGSNDPAAGGGRRCRYRLSRSNGMTFR